MSVDHDDLLKQLGALAARVDRLETEFASLRQQTPALGVRLPTAHVPAPKGVDLFAQKAAAPYPVSLPAPAAPRASLESRIGSQLFNRIGILALLIGAAWFLKLAIDNRWIGPLARVMIGVVCGAGIVAGSEWFRFHRYKAFSYSLKALGTGILYLSLWAAYSLFGLLPAYAAFAAMVLVTAANSWLCWRQNSEVLAFYAAIGGFLTPWLLWTSESREITLFSYLLLLDLAVLALVAVRPWSRLLLASFAGTAAYAVAWYVQQYCARKFGLTAFFVVAFFLLFSIAPQSLRTLRLTSEKASPTFEDNLALILLPLLNALLTFAELYALLSEPHATRLRSWVAFALAAFYLGMLRVTRSPRMSGTPARLRDTYLVLSVLAFTAAIPLACGGRLIALSWSAESALLFWLARRLNQRLLLLLSSAVLGLAFTAAVSLNSTLPGDLRLLWNPRFATYFTGVAAGVAAAWMASTAMEGETKAESAVKRDWRLAGIFAIAGATILAMIGVCLEIDTYWNGQSGLARSERILDEQFSYSAWTMLFGAGMLAAGFLRKMPTLRWIGLMLLALSIGKVFFFDLRELSQGYRILSFLGLGALLLAVSFVYQRDLLGLRRS